MSSIEEQIDCVEREIKQRRRVYPRLIARDKMSPQFAREQIDLMMDVLATLRSLSGPPRQSGLLDIPTSSE